MSTEQTSLTCLDEAAATGIGSMPGNDPREAARVVVGELATFPHLVELPGRGPGADMIGRSAGLLVELYAQLEPSGWRFAPRPGHARRRAVAWLREDLDALEEFTQGYTGPLKLQAAGVWTLSAAVQLRNGEAALSDAGARREIAASLGEGLREHVAEVRRRVPGAQVVLQLDEPMLPAVLAGRVPTASGYRTYAAPDSVTAQELLHEVIGAAGAPVVVHSCAPMTPVALLRRAGAAGVALDFQLITERNYDELGEAVEAGLALLAGVVPGTDAALSDPGGSVGGVRRMWRRLGLDPEKEARSVTVTPACGLSGASPGYARAALTHCVRAAKALADHPEP